MSNNSSSAGAAASNGSLDIDSLLEDKNDDCQHRIDDMLLGILQKDEKIDKFLDRIFNFLCRRTDFFLVQESPNVPFGFPPNVSKQTVQNIFQKYDSIPKEKLKKRLYELNHQAKNTSTTQQATTSATTTLAASKKTETSSNLREKNETKPSDDTAKADLKNKQEKFQSDPSSYNGAQRDKYSWTQLIKDIDVRIKIGPEVKTSKDVRVKFDKQELNVTVKDSSGTWSTLISDKLQWKIRPEESTWCLFPGDHIQIYMEKTEERWWERLLESEEKLDLQNMNPEKPMEELDEASQAKIRQMMFDEHQKRLGLPTSDEQKRLDILKDAWDMEGSPFKGQPFDPSVLKMN